MALAKGEHELPNLKIEIENDLDDAMEVDDVEITKQSTIVIHGRTKDIEEGEVCENKEDSNSEHRISKVLDAHPKTKNSSNRGDGIALEFGSSAEIFDGKHNETFGAKSMKFGLTPAEVKIISEDKLASLYKSLDMKDDEGTYKRYRLDAIHMRGTQDMSTEDVFAYFKDYSPASIEWINDYSCKDLTFDGNIVWISNMLAAKAIMEISKPIRGLESSHVKDPFAEEDKTVQRRKRLSSDAKGDDVVVMVTEVEDQDGEVLMVGDEETGEEESAKGKMIVDRKDSLSSRASEKNSGTNNETDTVHVSDISIPIPPGFWRLGKPSPRAKQVLLRFSLKTDRKPAKAEKMSDYYKKHGNPNYGGIKGLITKSRKRRFREKNTEVTLPKGNPWGSLAETWGNVDKRKAMNPEAFDRDGEVPNEFPARVPVPARFRTGQLLQVSHVHQRLHMDSTSVVPPRDVSPGPESDNSDEDVGRNGSSSAQWKRKIKQPRMRMYADEEEERVERRREQQRREAEVAAAVRRGVDFNKVARTPVSESRKEASQKKPANVVDLRQRLKTTNKGTKSVWNRLAQKDAVISDEEVVDDEAPAKVDLRASLTKKTFEGDLRSKLNRNKSLKQNSPLRIEIDNDEYYRITGGDQD
ncbi:hypothetical protein J437_LFUL009478 [Ladona fulva]|uniref:Nuclear cap-binding protein subunit 3 n=1 Tax=Ladona fulva TaxID=123851 RepID=A0A8K0NUV8_LADFU|nr:hypothetical protein J437_LFUL009478 [Ladona fulva]